jgi:hypothetical protein
MWIGTASVPTSVGSNSYHDFDVAIMVCWKSLSYRSYKKAQTGIVTYAQDMKQSNGDWNRLIEIDRVWCFVYFIRQLKQDSLVPSIGSNSYDNFDVAIAVIWKLIFYRSFIIHNRHSSLSAGYELLLVSTNGFRFTKQLSCDKFNFVLEVCFVWFYSSS